MKIDEDLSQLSVERDSALTIGVFDGVHRGHVHLIRRLISEAKSAGMLSGVVTFRNHPKTVLRPDFKTNYISDLDERIRLLKEHGIDFVVPVTFDRDLLRTFYLSEGYADFRVISAAAELTRDRTGFFITFTVDEGKRYRFGRR